MKHFHNRLESSVLWSHPDQQLKYWCRCCWESTLKERKNALNAVILPEFSLIWEPSFKITLTMTNFIDPQPWLREKCILKYIQWETGRVVKGILNLALIDRTSFHWQPKEKTCPEHFSCYVSWRDCYCCSFVMESKCSFFKLVVSICDYDKRYYSGDTVPLSSCDRCVGEYVSGVGISDISSEVELILARASTFSFPS